MKLTFGMILVFILGYVLARYWPGPGNMLGLP